MQLTITASEKLELKAIVTAKQWRMSSISLILAKEFVSFSSFLIEIEVEEHDAFV